MIEKLVSSSLNNVWLILILIFNLKTSANSQNNLDHIQLDYAHIYYKNSQYDLASEIYNGFANIDNFPKPEIAYAAFSNLKVGNTEMFLHWLSIFYRLNYTLLNNWEYSEYSLSEVEISEIKNGLSLIKSSINLSGININFELYKKIKGLGAIDQFIRVSGLFTPEKFKEIDTLFIFGTLMDILGEEFSLEEIQDAQIDLFVILIHQARYIDKFSELIEQNHLENLKDKNLLSPAQYAYIMDIYSNSKIGKMLYGNLFSIGMIDNLNGYNIHELNDARKSIGLCEIEIDYRNVKPIKTSEEILNIVGTKIK